MPALSRAAFHFAAAIAAIVGGLVIGYLDLQTSEVVVTLGILFVFNMALGAIAPRGGWFWPPITSSGVLFLNWFPQFAGVAPNPYLSRTVGSYFLLLILLVVAGGAGMLFGVIVRRSLHVPA